MHYPVWYLPGIGGGMLIAIIAVAHVFVSHFAVGGGLYLVLAERKGLRENSHSILEFTRRHSTFFLLVTTVFGAISGVGIWFVISLVNPAATSFLIRNFVFIWGMEWVMFAVELTAVYVYWQTFGKIPPATHQKIGWVYFVSALLSLFLINGIISFMLSPGGWREGADLWQAFFNPTFWPSLLFRISTACMLAGVFAFLSVSFLKEPEAKLIMSRFSGKWVLGAMLCLLPSAYWYLQSLPATARQLVEGVSPTLQTTSQWFTWALAAIFFCAVALTLIRPSFHTKPLSLALFIAAITFMGSFEWSREAARRPFVIDGIIYSNGMTTSDIEDAGSNGFAASNPWLRPVKSKVSDVEAGMEIFKFQCYACHTAGGINNDIFVRAKGMDSGTLNNYIANLHLIRPFMPPFAGSEDERQELAAFIATGMVRDERKVYPGGKP